jgi:hypothetical protein
MNAIVADLLMREAAEAETDGHPFTIVVLFGVVGFLASVCVASLGFDLGTGLS